MATAPEYAPPRQLLLDVDRPIVMRPRREREATHRAGPADVPSGQLEFRMSSAARPVMYPPIERPRPIVAVETVEVCAIKPDVEPFGEWLLNQSKRAGMLGELAKAVKLDRRFPKNGSVDDVRRHFGSIGAEGDAFEALDDAEREFDRLS